MTYLAYLEYCDRDGDRQTYTTPIDAVDMSDALALAEEIGHSRPDYYGKLDVTVTTKDGKHSGAIL